MHDENVIDLPCTSLHSRNLGTSMTVHMYIRSLQPSVLSEGLLGALSQEDVCSYTTSVPA